MFLLTAIFNKSCLHDVIQELFEQKIEGITVSDVIGKGGLGFSEQKGGIDLDFKVKIEIVVSDDEYKEKAKEAIRATTQDTGHGSGKMWVTPVLEVERIRTGELNEAALTQSIARTNEHHESYYSHDDTPSS